KKEGTEVPSREWHEERQLFRVADGPALTDDRDADLAGIGKVFFNLAGDALTEHVGLIVIHVFGIDHDADFAPGLNGVRFGYSVEFGSDVFQILKALDVAFQEFLARAGTG